MFSFTITSPQGKTVASITQISCMHDKRQLKQQQELGYTFIMNGKPWTLGSKVREMTEKEEILHSTAAT